MANDRMFLVNRDCKFVVHLAKHFGVEWYTPGELSPAMDDAFEAAFIHEDGPGRWEIVYEANPLSLAGYRWFNPVEKVTRSGWWWQLKRAMVSCGIVIPHREC